MSFNNESLMNYVKSLDYYQEIIPTYINDKVNCKLLEEYLDR